MQTYAEDGGEPTGLAGLGRAIVFQDVGNEPWNWNPNNPNYGSWLVRTTPTPAPVPEPATMLLLGSGLIGLAGFRRKFKK